MMDPPTYVSRYVHETAEVTPRWRLRGPHRDQMRQTAHGVAVDPSPPPVKTSAARIHRYRPL